MKEVLESSSKEAMYAMDDTNPLRLFDCLIPEITAYRPMKIFTAKKKADNFDAGTHKTIQGGTRATLPSQ